MGIILPMIDRIKAGNNGILNAINASGNPPLNSNIGNADTNITMTPGGMPFDSSHCTILGFSNFVSTSSAYKSCEINSRSMIINSALLMVLSPLLLFYKSSFLSKISQEFFSDIRIHNIDIQFIFCDILAVI